MEPLGLAPVEFQVVGLAWLGWLGLAPVGFQVVGAAGHSKAAGDGTGCGRHDWPSESQQHFCHTTCKTTNCILICSERHVVVVRSRTHPTHHWPWLGKKLCRNTLR